MIESLLHNAVWLLAMLLVLWVFSMGLREASFIDSVWGFSMAWLAWLSLWGTKFGSAALLVFVMAFFWGVRLGIHLLRRYLRNGEDDRYRKMLPDPQNLAAFAITALWKVFLLQGALIMLVSSPAQVGILAAYSEQPLSNWAWAGVALYLVGIFFEWVGDWQLARFKADPDNEGKVMDKGLWRYTRHPNYFGDACAWWGIFTVAMTIAPGAVIWTLPGPLFLTFTLVKWSGAAMTEKGMRNKYGKDFADYTRRTSAFIPLPPRT
ncbi:DUF1295 domain-containing protein [Aurantiacibacter zhengii]|uniref:DUF1295 domain-containing protein n=1 Tax=Aurantiacibacter zhengii TaxID=2307003 RepID=A0A418NPI4_9SPHN|nr:DUF1295 domain-containing protein [Aurantiacibacter zhengii]RIV83886.1 DUF1295 domain-containing protein [Aurantiacibacter zhengii]